MVQAVAAAVAAAGDEAAMVIGAGIVVPPITCRPSSMAASPRWDPMGIRHRMGTRRSCLLAGSRSWTLRAGGRILQTSPPARAVGFLHSLCSAAQCLAGQLRVRHCPLAGSRSQTLRAAGLIFAIARQVRRVGPRRHELPPAPWGRTTFPPNVQYHSGWALFHVIAGSDFLSSCYFVDMLWLPRCVVG